MLDTNVDDIKENDIKNTNNYFENTVTSSSFGNIGGTLYCNIPEFLLESQKEFIEMLKKEIQQKDAAMKEN